MASDWPTSVEAAPSSLLPPDDPSIDGIGWRRLGAVLVGEQLLTPEQLESMVDEQRTSGGRLGDIAVERGWLTAPALASAVARQHGVRTVDLADGFDPDLSSLLPRDVAMRCRALPARRLEGGRLLVAVTDPGDLNVIDDLRLVLGEEFELAVAEPDELDFALRRAYLREIEIHEDDADPTAAEVHHERVELWEEGTGAPAVRLVNQAIGQAVDERASDIHFLPQADGLHVRARVDGVMRELGLIPKKMQAAAISRLKILGSLDIAERRAPQDGRVFVRCNGAAIDLRIAVLPTTNGEQAVLRVLRRAAASSSLSDLGMAPDAAASFVEAIEQPFGAVIVCGPTGSGKTTTLYAALQRLNTPERTLITIEDPVEYELGGVAQIEVRPRAGLTFASGLRTILRSDPDVLLVGEIRDEETAQIAIQAAMTGHLVLTSLHTQNAASSVERLKDMGIDPSLIASSLNCIVAQRLARRLCTECKQPYEVSTAELAALGVDAHEARLAYRSVGCPRCSRTGFYGRVALYEVMPIQGDVRRLANSSPDEIFRHARQAGMRSLGRDGIRLWLDGVTSLDEIQRVTGNRLL